MTLALGAVLVAVLAVSAYVRLAPLDPARWHLPLATSATLATGPCAPAVLSQRNGARVACLSPGTPAEVLARLSDIARATRRTRHLAGSAEAGLITWVSRSRIIGFPDVITAQTTTTAEGTRLDVFAHQVYGNGDWGGECCKAAGLARHFLTLSSVHKYPGVRGSAPALST